MQCEVYSTSRYTGSCLADLMGLGELWLLSSYSEAEYRSPKCGWETETGHGLGVGDHSRDDSIHLAPIQTTPAARLWLRQVHHRKTSMQSPLR